jgi:Family of unknown function (DUF6328)
LGLLAILIGFLIVPTMHHRLVERGQATARMQRLATRMAALALALLAVALGIDVFIVVQRPMGLTGAIATGAAFMLAAFVGWFGFEYLRRRRKAMPETPEKDEATPLDQRIEQMLTEARVVLPGVQAMLGFDLLVTFTRAFEQLSGAAKAVSGACLRGADDDPLDRAGGLSPHYLRRPNTEEMHRIGSFLVTSAPLPLGLSIGANAYVAAVKITENAAIGAALAGTLCVVLLCLWYAMPFMRRRAVPG